jgi:hypothetical protein
MATVSEVREAMHRVPFQPFALRLADGRTYTVRHHDFIAIPHTPRGREVVLYAEGEDAETPEVHWVDLTLVSEIIAPAPGEIEPAPQATPPPGNGNIS